MPSYKIIVSPAARGQITRNARYIRDELGLPQSALDLIDAIDDKFSVLTAFPYAYPVDEKASILAGKEIRCASMKAYRLLYRVDAEKNEIHILSLRFGSENPKALRRSDLQG